jgi:hypothetical protein
MMANTPDSIANRSPDSLHVRGSDAAHQQIVINGDKAKSFVLAASLIINIICIFTIAFGAFIYYQAQALDQNRYDWLQRDTIVPMQGKISELDKETQAMMIKLQEKR